MRRLVLILLIALVWGIPVRPVSAYSFQYSASTRPVPLRWATRTIPISLSSSLLEQQPNIKAGSDVIGAVRRGLARWADAAGVEFNETIVKDDSISPATGTGDGRSLITVALTAENLTPFAGASNEMPARTRVFFNRGGAITEADIALNPYQQFSTDGTVGTYDLESALTHELGHLLGLEHSGVIGSTMQPRQGRNGLYGLPATATRTLSEDDRAGVQALYASTTSKSRTTGSIAGVITRANGQPVFGASVWAEDAESGRFIAAYTTEADGSYEFTGLAPRQYHLFVEGLDGPIAANELAAQRGPYAKLDQSQLAKFRARDLGQQVVEPGKRVELNGGINLAKPELNPYLIGFNAQLSTVPVPLTPGRTYRVYLGGDGLDPEKLFSVTTSSPFLTVDRSTIVEQQFGPKLSVITFDVTVAAEAPNGEYSIRVQNRSGETAYLAAGLTIDGTVNPWPIFTF
jgi:hypothetical protein